MTFCTAINCMDGRVQLPVIRYLQQRFGVEYVDTITEPGPNRILAERTNAALVQSILTRLNISVEKHGSRGIAVVGHHDCAGNPASREEQVQHIAQAVEFLRGQYAGMEIIGLWANERWQVEEV
ncbi:MAG: hypothetical protein Q9P14_09635 [candidate division KSB1 bacterium]|nr:hypothetical protein [candidate division KSB1 bacterium]